MSSATAIQPPSSRLASFTASSFVLPSADQVYRAVVPERRSDETTNHLLGTGGQGLLWGAANSAERKWRGAYRSILEELNPGSDRWLKLGVAPGLPQNTVQYIKREGMDKNFRAGNRFTTLDSRLKDWRANHGN